MRGTSNIEEGAIVPNSKQSAGVVTKIDPNGLFITVKLDNAGTKTYYVKNSTTIIKGKSTVDLSALYEGDRVKLKFASADTTAVSEINIVTSGIMVENLYKAKLNTVNTSKNTFTVQNSHPFTNWLFGENEKLDKNTFNFSSNTTIYAGNEKISEDQLKNYKNSDMYFVTTKQFSKEVVEKIVVLASNERSYYQSLSEVNSKYGYFALTKVGRLFYHDGSILVRNGRLVEPDTLAANGTAYVITDGTTSDKYAHVVNVTNDSFTSPNLSSHQLYFGRLDLADLDAYKVELSGMEYFKNNFWTKFNTESIFSFSNSTAVTELDGDTQYKIIPETELFLYEGQYGYFYVKDGHIQAIHFIKNQARTSITATGRIDRIGTNEISVKDVSQWVNGGEWSYFGETKVELNKVVIIKNGKAIKASELKPSDRVVLLMDENFVTHVVMVNE
ncbi:MAG: phosphate ABC transporter ATPase [Solibacillus sp.]